MSNRYIGDLRSRIGQFARYFKGKRVSEFTFSEVDAWLRSLGVKITTRNNFRRALVVTFNFAKEHGYRTSNPAEKISHNSGNGRFRRYEIAGVRTTLF